MPESSGGVILSVLTGAGGDEGDWDPRNMPPSSVPEVTSVVWFFLASKTCSLPHCCQFLITSWMYCNLHGLAYVKRLTLIMLYLMLTSELGAAELQMAAVFGLE